MDIPDFVNPYVEWLLGFWEAYKWWIVLGGFGIAFYVGGRG